MVGGNVKGIINGELDLSLPKVEDCDGPTTGMGSTVVRMGCAEGTLTVTLLQPTEAALSV
jgi:hypothetical protein